MNEPSPVFKNRLLTALSGEDLALLRPHLQPVELKQRDVLYNAGMEIEHRYFIESGVASVLTTLQNGASVEVGMVGAEGMVSLSALFGEAKSPQYIVMQLRGAGLKISAAVFRTLFEENPGIRKVVLRFSGTFFNLTARSAACNRLHAVEQRFARWLLMSSDRAASNDLPLTQEYLSAMLGVRRAGISETAIELQRSGLIRYNHGNIKIIDRSELEKIACECYRLDREEFNRLTH